MKTVTVETVWRARDTVEVDDDFDESLSFPEWPVDVLEQIDAGRAELVDWTVKW